jgi:hypothetical protein
MLYLAIQQSTDSIYQIICKQINNFRNGVNVIREHGKLTTVGKGILTNLIDYVEIEAVKYVS